MKSWYSKVRDTELIDGSVIATYVVTFETDNIELKREVEKYLQGIMGRTADRKTEPTSCKTCRYGEVDEGYVRCAYYSKADRKTEPSGYCNECKWYGDKQVCGRCRSRNLYAPKDEPQTIVIPKAHGRKQALQMIDEYNLSIGRWATKAEDEPQIILNDGTLVINVEDATKVGRVLVGDDKNRGGLYYLDDVDEPQTERSE